MISVCATCQTIMLLVPALGQRSACRQTGYRYALAHRQGRCAGAARLAHPDLDALAGVLGHLVLLERAPTFRAIQPPLRCFRVLLELLCTWLITAPVPAWHCEPHSHRPLQLTAVDPPTDHTGACHLARQQNALLAEVVAKIGRKASLDSDRAERIPCGDHLSAKHAERHARWLEGH